MVSWSRIQKAAQEMVSALSTIDGLIWADLG